MIMSLGHLQRPGWGSSRGGIESGLHDLGVSAAGRFGIVRTDDGMVRGTPIFPISRTEFEAVGARDLPGKSVGCLENRDTRSPPKEAMEFIMHASIRRAQML